MGGLEVSRFFLNIIILNQSIVDTAFPNLSVKLSSVDRRCETALLAPTS